jgi:hypothetical protein
MLKSFVLSTRPFLIFDPKNPEHRDIFNKFQRTQSWQHSPYQWTIDDDSTNLVHYLNKKLVAYYLSTEFDKPARTKRTKPVLKIKDIKTRRAQG